MLREALASHDLVLWIDADAVIVDSSRDIADELAPDRFLGLVRHGDVPNTGVMLLRSGDLARDLLDRTWSATRLIDHPWWENAALLDALGYDLPGALEPGLRGRGRGWRAPRRPRAAPLRSRAPVAVHRRHPVPAARVEQRLPRPAAGPGSCTASACRSSSACATCEPRSADPFDGDRRVQLGADPPPSSASGPRNSSSTSVVGPGTPPLPGSPSPPGLSCRASWNTTTPPGVTQRLNSSQSRRQLSSAWSPSTNTRSTGSAHRLPSSWLRSMCQRSVGPPRSSTARSTTRASGPCRAAPAGGQTAAVDERVDQVQHRVERQGAREHERGRALVDADLDRRPPRGGELREQVGLRLRVHQPRRDQAGADGECAQPHVVADRVRRETADGLRERHGRRELTCRACPPASMSPFSRSAPRSGCGTPTTRSPSCSRTRA